MVVCCVFKTLLTYCAYGQMLVLAQVSSFHVSAPETLQFAFAISVAAGIAVTILATWHGFLIATAQVL